MTNNHKIATSAILILLIEDEKEMADSLKWELEYSLREVGEIVIDIAGSLEDAEKKARLIPYTAIKIDLRLPKRSGGVVDGTPAGLQVGAIIGRYLPLALPVIWSNYAHKHPSAAHFAGQHECPYWSKGTAKKDVITELKHYTAEEGAQAFGRMLGLWPAQCSQPLEDEEISWAGRFFRRGRALFPEQLAMTCGHLAGSMQTNSEAQAQMALNAVFSFSDWVQRWLWCITAAVLRSSSFLEKAPPWPRGINGRYLTRATTEESLAGMLACWATSKTVQQNCHLLRFINCHNRVPDTMDIIDALAAIRTTRNDWAHSGIIVGGQTALNDLSPAMRIVMNAAHFLAAWPMVTEIESIGNRWRLTCVRGQFPWPKEEWHLDLPPNFQAQPNHVYQIYPYEDGTIRLVDLWPWLECRPDETLQQNRIWQVLGPSDGVHIYESNFNDTKEIKFTKNRPAPPYRAMSSARWDELDKIKQQLKLG